MRPFLVVLLVLTSCAAQPPERSPLPDIESILPEAQGCQLSVGEPIGVLVTNIIDDSPAVGLLELGDVIESINGTSTKTIDELSIAMSNVAPGDVLSLQVRRDESPTEVSLATVPNPTNPSRALIGVNITTGFETIGVDEASSIVTPSPSARALQIANTIHLFDPLTKTWQDTGIEPPAEARWVSTSSGFYTTTGGDRISILNLLTGNQVPDDGFGGWEANRIIGVVGDTLILMVSAESAEDPDLINIAMAGLNPVTGETLWVSPVAPSFGVPGSAFGSQDGTAFVGVGVDFESGETSGVVLFDAFGTPQATEDLSALGEPIGWFDGQAMTFRTDDSTVSTYNFIERTSTSFDLPQTLTASAIAAVGDGENVLAVQGRTMVLQSLDRPLDNAPLATNCRISRIGEPGWGV